MTDSEYMCMHCLYFDTTLSQKGAYCLRHMLYTYACKASCGGFIIDRRFEGVPMNLLPRPQQH